MLLEKLEDIRKDFVLDVNSICDVEDRVMLSAYEEIKAEKKPACYDHTLSY